MPAVGLYCMELEFRLNEEYLISKRIKLYPWIRWNPHLTDRVVNVDCDTELCHSGVVESLPNDVPCLTLSDIGIMCDIPTVSKCLTDMSLQPKHNSADDDVLYKHATVRHLEAADELLSVLSDAVRLRVMYQDARCHVCLLQQHAADDAPTYYLSSIPSTNSPDELIAASSVISFEAQSDCGLAPTYKTSWCDVRTECSIQTADDAVSSCCDPLLRAFTQQLQCLSSSPVSSRQVCNVELSYISITSNGSC